MVVYADVLIAVNIIVDYFLLKLTSRFLGKSPPLIRMVSGAVLGGLFALWIFVPVKSRVLQFVVQILFAFMMSFAVFGFLNLKAFLRNTLTFLSVSLFYCGLMFLTWYFLRPNGMIIHNSVVYFNVSPLFLTVFSVAGYFISAFLRSVFSKNNAVAFKCEVTVYLNKKSITLKGIVDSGNSLSDPFGLSEVMIVSREKTALIFENENLDSRYRALPLKTVTGETMLDGYRIDKAVIKTESKTVEISRPILAISNTDTEDIGVIVNPRTVG